MSGQLLTGMMINMIKDQDQDKDDTLYGITGIKFSPVKIRSWLDTDY